MRRLFQGMRPFNRSGAVRDALAGFALAAMNIPQSLGYASIALMPPVTGLYTLLGPLFAFAMFGSSRYLVVAADSATAAILAAGLTPLAAPGTAAYMTSAAMVALLTAGMLVVARILKLGFVADFLSQTVLMGFLTGVGFQVGTAVTGQMLGLRITATHTVTQFAEIVRQLGRVHLPSLGLSALVVFGVLGLDRISKKIPGSLLAVVGTIAASAAWNFAGHGIAVIGPVENGLPHLVFPRMGWEATIALVPVAGSCFVMIVTQSAAIGRIYALRYHEKLDENEDLAGLAAANASAAISGAFPVNGSLTQTAMVEASGGRSQVAHLATAVVVAIALLFLTHPIQFLPRCVLGAIVFLVAVRLLKFQELREIRRESPGEYWLAIIVAAIVIVVGVEQGIVAAMVLSLLRIVRNSYHPHSAVLLHDEEGTWQLMEPKPGAQSEEGLAIYRFAAPLFYANASRFADEMRGLATPELRLILVDAGAITRIDYSAARAVETLLDDLKKSDVGLAFARVTPDLRADLDRHLLTPLIGMDRLFEKFHPAIVWCRRQIGTAPAKKRQLTD